MGVRFKRKIDWKLYFLYENTGYFTLLKKMLIFYCCSLNFWSYI